MVTFFGMSVLVVVLSIVTSLCNAASASPSQQHYTNLIVGGGPAGLYTAWRLGSRQNETTAIFEWSPERLGGRIFTKWISGGKFLELGGMRFLSGHKLLQEVLRQLKLRDEVLDFRMTDNRLYYVRGQHIYQKDISKGGMPYNTTDKIKESDSLFLELAEKMHPSKQNDRAHWCTFFDEGRIPAGMRSNSFKKNDLLGNIGYWNLLADQLGSEGHAYMSDAGGFASNTLNSNAAYSIFYNGDFESSSKYQRLKMGFSSLIKKFEQECRRQNVKIKQGQRLIKFHWDANKRRFYSTFNKYNSSGKPTGEQVKVTSDRLFLCVPKRALDLIEEEEVTGNPWPPKTERRVLKHAAGRFYIDSVIEEPASKIALVYNEPWWLDAEYKPHLDDSSKGTTNKATPVGNYGPTVTDLPIRNIYYFDHKKEPKNKTVYGILAAYNDMRYTEFWEQLELPTNESLSPQHHSFLSPLFSGVEMNEAMLQTIREQLNSVHYRDSRKLQVPTAVKGYFMNWGRDPYGSGYHTWKAHYKIADAQHYMTRPSEAIGVSVPLYVAGEAYSYDQSWVEGALTTAEAVLVEKIGLSPLLNSSVSYPLICHPKSKGKKSK